LQNISYKFFFRIIGRIQLWVLFFTLLWSPLYSQEIIISGKVFEKATNQVLSTVSVYDKLSLRGTVTDNSGFFKISLPAGGHSIEFSIIGFEHYDTTLNLTENIELFIYMSPVSYKVAEITITADAQKDHVSSPLMGAFKLTNIEMTKLPSL
jgi:hypothetical protein